MPARVALSLKILLLFTTLGHSYRILGLFPHPAKSHVNVFYPLMKGLALKGHDVTFVSHYKFNDNISTLKEMQIVNPGADLVDAIDMSQLLGNRIQMYLNNVLLAYWAVNTCHDGLSSPVFQELLNSDESFDLVIMEFFNTDCYAPFAYKFKAHLIGLSSCTIMHWTHERFANIYNPSYIPITHMDYSDRLNFFERVENTVLGILHEILYNYILRYNDERIARMYFKEDFPSLTKIVHNASVFLVNTHFSLNLPKPLVPAVIDIGGIHINKVKKVPQDLEKWINESTHGVIYFSLGSMIKGHTFPDEKRSEFLKAFGRLPQRVLWKWENETMSGKPDNVMIQKWMPQLDILCHPNVKAFISHGGLLGTTEAVHCGVPVVVMPQYGDQFTNARALEANGGGVILHLSEATEEKIHDALRTILDPQFQKQAKELSARFRDRPLPPLETAIYWVEYVARHRGAHHMRTAAVDMPLYKYLLLDVIAFLLLVAGLVFALFFYVTRAVFRKLFTKRDKQKTN
ncbi:UDP-glycosyltransferase UGT5-like isoform X1 [Tribolium madens]|uniref:UDP-glycosyltransferase UGT5-like isoform X1 n=1 Tax=Tribolium madens TaxID=41895 RepID=UPI001CF726AB|nr:UDP-glycosyltransferase UGT5-like isoform X1 [Tribolium madens]